MCARLEEAHTKPTYTQRDDSPLEDAGRLCRISPDATDKFTVKEEAFTVPNLPDHLVPEEFAGNEWFVEEQYERYQQDKISWILRGGPFFSPLIRPFKELRRPPPR